MTKLPVTCECKVGYKKPNGLCLKCEGKCGKIVHAGMNPCWCANLVPCNLHPQKTVEEFPSFHHLEGLNQELTDLLDKNFPKRKCQERGPALVFHAEAQILLKKLLKEQKKKVEELRQLECVLGHEDHIKNCDSCSETEKYNLAISHVLEILNE